MSVVILNIVEKVVTIVLVFCNFNYERDIAL